MVYGLWTQLDYGLFWSFEMTPLLPAAYLSWFCCVALATWLIAKQPFAPRSFGAVGLLGPSGAAAEALRRRRRMVFSLLALIGKLTPIPEKQRDALKDKLGQIGSRLAVEDFLGLKVLAGLGCCFIVVVIMRELGRIDPVWLVPIGIFGWLIPDLRVSSRIRSRHRAILRLLPEAIDLLALCIGAGLDFLGALTRIVTVRAYSKDPLVEELSVVLHEMKLGKRRTDALKAMAKRVSLPELTSFVRTLVQADRMGTPISEALAIHSEDLRMRRFMSAERASLKAPIKLLLPLILFILPCVGLIVGAPIFLQFMHQNPFAKTMR